VRLNCAPIDRELIRLEFFTTSMQAFFKYTWNNFLHATVEQIVGGVLESDNLTLQLALVTPIVDRYISLADVTLTHTYRL
jgi:hypothetical protein